MELQYFIDPKDQDQEYEKMAAICLEFFCLTKSASKKKNIQWHEHDQSERAHYATKAHDIYFKYPQGFKETMGYAQPY
jgi:glycyl-tRNA synthetase (class II)